jgi:hypothetical protein
MDFTCAMERPSHGGNSANEAAATNDQPQQGAGISVCTDAVTRILRQPGEPKPVIDGKRRRLQCLSPAKWAAGERWDQNETTLDPPNGPNLGPAGSVFARRGRQLQGINGTT